MTPLHRAISGDRPLGAVFRLLEYGADIGATDAEGRTVEQIVQEKLERRWKQIPARHGVLLELGGDPAPEGCKELPVTTALVHGNGPVAEVLFDATTKTGGRRVWGRDDEWRRNLCLAIRCHADGVVERMLTQRTKNSWLAKTLADIPGDRLRNEADRAARDGGSLDADGRPERIAAMLKTAFPEVFSAQPKPDDSPATPGM